MQLHTAGTYFPDLTFLVLVAIFALPLLILSLLQKPAHDDAIRALNSAKRFALLLTLAAVFCGAVGALLYFNGIARIENGGSGAA